MLAEQCRTRLGLHESLVNSELGLLRFVKQTKKDRSDMTVYGGASCIEWIKNIMECTNVTLVRVTYNAIDVTVIAQGQVPCQHIFKHILNRTEHSL